VVISKPFSVYDKSEVDDKFNLNRTGSRAITNDFNVPLGDSRVFSGIEVSDTATLSVDGDLIDIDIDTSGNPAHIDTGKDILTKLKAVDGAGSGLDADTVDGVQGASLALTANVVSKSFITQYYQAISSANGDVEVGGSGVFTLAITTKKANSPIRIHARHFGESSNAQDLVFNIHRNGVRINTNGDNSLFRGLSMPCQTYGSAADDNSTPEIMEVTTIDNPNVAAGTTITYTLVMARSSTAVLGTYTNRCFANTGSVNYEDGTSEMIVEELL